MKKVLSVLLALAMLLPMIAMTGAAADEEIVLRVVDWSDSSAAYREVFHQEFEAAHPGVKIEYTLLTLDQFKNTIITMIKSGDGPDIFPVPSGMTLAAAVEEEWYQPLDSYLPAEFLATIDPSCLVDGLNYVDGKLYSISENKATLHWAFFYNKDLLAAAGVEKVPETIDEFVEACRLVTEAGHGSFYGLIEGGKQLNRLDAMARAFAASAGDKVAGPTLALADENGRASFDGEGMLAFFDMINRLNADGSIHPDTVNMSAPEARELFAQGQAAFLMQGMWCIAPWDAAYPELNYGVMGVPKPSVDTVGAMQNAEGTAWMGVYSQSKHPELAAEYLRCLYSEDYSYQASCVANGNYVSIIPSVNEKNVTNTVMQEYLDVQARCSAIFPSLTQRDSKGFEFYAQVKDVQPSLGAIVQGALAGAIDDPKAELTALSEATTAEWHRAAEAAGMDYNSLIFADWTVGVDYIK